MRRHALNLNLISAICIILIIVGDIIAIVCALMVLNHDYNSFDTVLSVMRVACYSSISAHTILLICKLIQLAKHEEEKRKGKKEQ